MRGAPASAGHGGRGAARSANMSIDSYEIICVFSHIHDLRQNNLILFITKLFNPVNHVDPVKIIRN